MDDLAAARVVVSGRVQGVFYRQTTKDKARSLGLVGWVRNQEDGSVALEASGPRERVMQLIDWCRKGPPAARVDDVQVEWLEQNSGAANFDIVR
jgi:acylphosphatase